MGIGSPPWPSPSEDPDLRHCFEILRGKWGEVPAGKERVQSADLNALTDEQLSEYWDSAHQSTLDVRDWFQVLYCDVFKGKRVLDVGCGLAISSLHFAKNGAEVTFLDIVPENVGIVKRLCAVKQIQNAKFCIFDDLRALEMLGEYDAIFCCGSLINAPLELMRVEVQALLKHLIPGGRWIELAYPKERWLREGSLAFEKWGEETDGGAPWMEWHDLDKVRWYLQPVEFDVILSLEFYNQDFNWFDLRRRE
jgi:SAM-dependent methyltransferase